MSINQNNVKKLTENLQKSHNEYSSSYYTFFKNITTICTGLIALIIGLKPEQILCFYSKVFFLLSISFIGLCILFSLIVQYAEIYIKKELIKISNSQLINYIENPDKSKIMSNSVTDTPVSLFRLRSCSISIFDKWANTWIVLYLNYPFSMIQRQRKVNQTGDCYQN